MPRTILDEAQLHPAIRERVARLNADLVQQVRDAAAGIAHHDIDVGNYFGRWRRRNALKMWTGWPTFPMVFVKGVLIGGAAETEALIAGGEMARLLA